MCLMIMFHKLHCCNLGDGVNRVRSSVIYAGTILFGYGPPAIPETGDIFMGMTIYNFLYLVDPAIFQNVERASDINIHIGLGDTLIIIVWHHTCHQNDRFNIVSRELIEVLLL